MAESPTDRYGFPPEAYDPSRLPDYNTNFLGDNDLAAFISALHAPDPAQNHADDITSPHSPRSPSSFLDPDRTQRKGSSVSLFDTSESQSVAAQAAAQAGDVSAPSGGEAQHHHHHHHGVYGNARSPTPGSSQSSMFITAQNDWAPIHERVHHKRRRDARKTGGGGGRGQALLGTRTKDETREGYLYSLLKWPMLFFVGAWLVGLALTYLYTRLYIMVYEQFVAWRGRRRQLRLRLRRTHRYADWVAAARELDRYLGRDRWKEENNFAYYDSKTIRRVWEQLRRCRLQAEADEKEKEAAKVKVREKEKMRGRAVEDLRALLEACVKNNFVGVENPRLYSQTYYGTKNLVQNFVDEGESCSVPVSFVPYFLYFLPLPPHLFKLST